MTIGIYNAVFEKYDDLEETIKNAMCDYKALINNLKGLETV